jgi:hypothetical protein
MSGAGIRNCRNWGQILDATLFPYLTTFIENSSSFFLPAYTELLLSCYLTPNPLFEFSPAGDACRLRVEIINRTPFAMSDGGALLAPWRERLRIMSLFELAPEQIANVQLIRDLAPAGLS